MQFSQRLIIIAVVVLMGLLVLLFSALSPATSTGAPGGYLVYLPFLFK
jgi:hypothetical protein